MLEVRDLACVRGDQPLFAGLAFGVAPGEVLWIEGGNGSGKTSLLRILCGLSLPEAGEVRWHGRTVPEARDAFAADVLYVGHANALKDDLTVVENLRFQARLAGIRVDEGAIGEAVRAVGLGHRSELPVRVLSQGQRRRVALARLWLSERQRLWILDEPFSALDAVSVRHLAERIGAHTEAGGAAILTTHQEVDLPGACMRRFRLDA